MPSRWPPRAHGAGGLLRRGAGLEPALYGALQQYGPHRPTQRDPEGKAPGKRGADETMKDRTGRDRWQGWRKNRSSNSYTSQSGTYQHTATHRVAPSRPAPTRSCFPSRDANRNPGTDKAARDPNGQRTTSRLEARSTSTARAAQAALRCSTGTLRNAVGIGRCAAPAGPVCKMKNRRGKRTRSGTLRVRWATASLH